jgi:hypothetical protein
MLGHVHWYIAWAELAKNPLEPAELLKIADFCLTWLRELLALHQLSWRFICLGLCSTVVEAAWCSGQALSSGVLRV